MISFLELDNYFGCFDVDLVDFCIVLIVLEFYLDNLRFYCTNLFSLILVDNLTAY